VSSETSQPAPRGDRPQQSTTRGEIVDAAVALFADKGFRATSLADIADSVGIRKASLYYHFPNKAMLLDEVFGRVINGLTNLPMADVSLMLSPCQRFGLIVAEFVRFHHENRAFLRIFWRERHELPPDAFANMRQREIGYENFVRDLLVEGQAQGCFNESLDLELAVESSLGLLTTVYRWHPVEDSEANTQRVIEHTAGVLLRGLGGTCTHQPRLTGRSA
jgi:AcrR family transcriptional regulator